MFCCITHHHAVMSVFLQRPLKPPGVFIKRPHPAAPAHTPLVRPLRLVLLEQTTREARANWKIKNRTSPSQELRVVVKGPTRPQALDLHGIIH
jgi:hypothetical protein